MNCAEIIKTDDMMANLPVPRSSSEVVKPSELFLDLMMSGTKASRATSWPEACHSPGWIP